MTPLPASLVTVSRLRSVNRHTLCRLSLPPSVANGIVCRCKRSCWHTYQLSRYSTIEYPFLSTINNPAILARGGQCIGTKKATLSGGCVARFRPSRRSFCGVRAWVYLLHRRRPEPLPVHRLAFSLHHRRARVQPFGTRPIG